MGMIIAESASQVYPADWLNELRGISIPPWLWEEVFRTPDAPMHVLLSAGDKIQFSGREGSLRVAKVFGPYETSGGGIRIDEEPRPPHYVIACYPAWRVYPDINDIEIFGKFIVSKGRILDMYKRSEREVYVVRRGRVGSILSKYAKLSQGVVATRPDQAYASDNLNKLHNITIPRDEAVWKRMFRMTPEGQPKVSQLVKVGDVIESSTEKKRYYRVSQVLGPFFGEPGAPRPPHYSLAVAKVGSSQRTKKFKFFNELVAVDGKIRQLYLLGQLEIVVKEKGGVSKILERYRKK